MRRPLLAFVTLAWTFCGTLWGCGSVDDRLTVYLGPTGGPATTAPDYAQYKAGVDAYLGKRCGSLDCHGQVGRPLRLFSSTGLRGWDAGPPLPITSPNNPGGAATTEDEIKDNYFSVIGLEPEMMRQVILDGGRNPNQLLLLKKPRLLESHKGGQVMNCPSGVPTCADEGYKCVTSWIGGKMDQTQCDQAASVP